MCDLEIKKGKTLVSVAVFTWRENTIFRESKNEIGKGPEREKKIREKNEKTKFLTKCGHGPVKCAVPKPV